MYIAESKKYYDIGWEVFSMGIPLVKILASMLLWHQIYLQALALRIVHLTNRDLKK